MSYLLGFILFYDILSSATPEHEVHHVTDEQSNRLSQIDVSNCY